MPIDDELRELFARGGGPTGSIDTAEVIRRSGRRRFGQQAVVGGATTLAVAGIAVAGVSGIRLLSSSGSATSSAISGGYASSPSLSSPEGGKESISRAPAEKLNLCGGGLADVAPAQSGLVATANFTTADASAASVTGTVTLTNTGGERITGNTAATPIVTLSQDGMTLWHSNGPMIAMVAIVDLEPGASMTLPASFSPVRCAVEDDADGFRADLPHVSPGSYQVSAALDVTLDGSSVSELVTGPTSDITVR